MSIQHIQQRVHLLRGVTSVGVIHAGEGQAILIDTGLGDRSGRRIMRALAQQGLTPVAILATHGHGDHTGGIAHITGVCGASVYAPALDATILEQPSWGTACLLGGAEPLPELEVPRYAPPPCRVDVRLEPGPHQIAGVDVQALSLPGHTGSHMGYLVDDILFTGDALAGEREIQTTPISYVYSMTKQLATLATLAAASYAGFVLGHGGFKESVTELVQANLKRIEDLAQQMITVLRAAPTEFNDLLAVVCQHYDLSPRQIRDYFLLQATLYACLSHLYRQEAVGYSLDAGRLFWHAT